ncbi:hypothetical protein CH063_00564 [Colletotrichum higginsianum]|uniref:Uncharacterized protein n=1 Tax=Colletotrichum higginsianum (strain IMI 349063) TaxID=759273 RepID=H1VZE9_COLHI|nr:hypothetical protein CH063_00564 [Colletotrichum higginsianum]
MAPPRRGLFAQPICTPPRASSSLLHALYDVFAIASVYSLHPEAPSLVSHLGRRNMDAHALCPPKPTCPLQGRRRLGPTTFLAHPGTFFRWHQHMPLFLLATNTPVRGSRDYELAASILLYGLPEFMRCFSVGNLG